jgi:hypothetical protein
MFGKHVWQVRVILLVLFCIVVRSHAQSPADEMRKAAVAWLEASAELRSKAVFAAEDPERQNWNFVPMSRKGAPLGDMNARQRELAHNLLRSALSQRGFLQATTIISLELVLREIEKNDMRDPERYFLTIFGKPQTDTTWGWRFEGHHLSLNFMIIDGKQVTVAPSFFGSNPADSARDGAKVRPLGEEEDLARALVKSLDRDQRQAAIFQEIAPRDIITGTHRTVERLEPAGISFTKLTSDQQQKLKELVGIYVNRYRPELAREDLQRIEKSGWQAVSFGWAGGLEKGQGHYYRVQGPTFLLEYDNTQNRANHIHTVWRDLERDFGGDPLREHYRTSGHHNPPR